MIIIGKVYKYGDFINTDVLYPGKYLNITDPQEMKLHALEGLDSEFVKNFKPGGIIVAGKFFGCGSSREQAATALKYAGVGAVVAESFARIYFRNAINQGLPIVVCPKVSEFVNNGDEIKIDLKAGILDNLTQKKSLKFTPLPEFIMGILLSGGLIPYLKAKKSYAERV